ncbi:MAG: T9SS type A sorting domain-containing protein [Bacteroidales bacterium]|nr:T9SS type A sorting domain-containing protein [Bacteroidales bacterium]
MKKLKNSILLLLTMMLMLAGKHANAQFSLAGKNYETIDEAIANVTGADGRISWDGTGSFSTEVTTNGINKNCSLDLGGNAVTTRVTFSNARVSITNGSFSQGVEIDGSSHISAENVSFFAGNNQYAVYLDNSSELTLWEGTSLNGGLNDGAFVFIGSNSFVNINGIVSFSGFPAPFSFNSYTSIVIDPSIAVFYEDGRVIEDFDYVSIYKCKYRRQIYYADEIKVTVEWNDYLSNVFFNNVSANLYDKDRYTIITNGRWEFQYVPEDFEIGKYNVYSNVTFSPNDLGSYSKLEVYQALVEFNIVPRKISSIAKEVVVVGLPDRNSPDGYPSSILSGEIPGYFFDFSFVGDQGPFTIGDNEVRATAPGHAKIKVSMKEEYRKYFDTDNYEQLVDVYCDVNDFFVTKQRLSWTELQVPKELDGANTIFNCIDVTFTGEQPAMTPDNLDDGLHKFTYSNGNSFNVFIDKTPPKGGVVTIGDGELDLERDGFYRMTTSQKISITDWSDGDGVGVDSVMYVIYPVDEVPERFFVNYSDMMFVNDGDRHAKNLYAGPFNYSSPGEYVIFSRATDKLHNAVMRNEKVLYGNDTYESEYKERNPNAYRKFVVYIAPILESNNIKLPDEYQGTNVSLGELLSVISQNCDAYYVDEVHGRIDLPGSWKFGNDSDAAKTLIDLDENNSITVALKFIVDRDKCDSRFKDYILDAEQDVKLTFDFLLLSNIEIADGDGQKQTEDKPLVFCDGVGSLSISFQVDASRFNNGGQNSLGNPFVIVRYQISSDGNIVYQKEMSEDGKEEIVELLSDINGIRQYKISLSTNDLKLSEGDSHNFDLVVFGATPGADEFVYSSIPRSFSISMGLPADRIVRLYDDILMVNNKDSAFSEFKWLLNGQEINDKFANRQAYKIPVEKLQESTPAKYSLDVVKADGTATKICPAEIAPISKLVRKYVAAYPNPAKAYEEVSLQLVNFLDEELANAEVIIYNNLGNVVLRMDSPDCLIKVSLPSGIYSGSVVAGSQKVSFKFIVQ